MSMSPGYTVVPLPSMTTASAGTGTDAPTASMTPFRITTVPDGSVRSGGGDDARTGDGVDVRCIGAGARDSERRRPARRARRRYDQ